MNGLANRRSDRGLANLGSQLDACGGIAPGFNFLRLTAAMAVLFSHSFELASSAGWPEPFRHFSGGQTSIGGSAVYIFFIISGFLVTASYQKSQDVLDFVLKRALRILPALVIVILLTAFVLGPTMTTLPLTDYFSDERFRSYLLNALTIGGDSLAGVYEDLPAKGSVNGSLWTLRYELICYALVIFAGASGLLYRHSLLLVLAVPLVVLGWWAKNKSVYFFEPLGIEVAYLFRFVGYFVAGMTIWIFRHHIVLDWRYAAAAALLSLIALHFGLYHLLFPLLGGYLVVFLAMRLQIDFLSQRDYSYGIYLYAFPIQQLVVALAPGQPFCWTNMLLSAPPTIICAVLSWHLVEKRALLFFRSLKSDRPVPLQPASTPQAVV
jgi:peptidoglycan/LPS O-acetylase OafA/YrhL